MGCPDRTLLREATRAVHSDSAGGSPGSPRGRNTSPGPAWTPPPRPAAAGGDRRTSPPGRPRGIRRGQGGARQRHSGYGDRVEEIDRKILLLLAHEGRMSFTDLARQTGLSVSATHQRVRRLERRGLIRGYAAVIDPADAGLPLTAFISIKPFDPAAAGGPTPPRPRPATASRGTRTTYSRSGSPPRPPWRTCSRRSGPRPASPPGPRSC